MQNLQRSSENVAFRCMVCSDPVDPSEVVRVNARICQKQTCKDAMKAMLREAKKVLYCPLCSRPASARERASWKRWKVAESVLAHVFYPNLFRTFREAGGTVEEFNRRVQEVPGFVPHDLRIKDAAELKKSLEENSADIGNAIKLTNSVHVQAGTEGDPA